MDYRAKNRYRYVRKKATGYSASSICWLISLGGFFTAAIACLGLLMYLTELPGSWPFFVPFIVVGLVAGFAGIHNFARIYEQTKALPYVPPVREQIANLRADEVLVRGAVAPAIASEDLLRVPAVAGLERQGELLQPAGDGGDSHLPRATERA